MQNDVQVPVSLDDRIPISMYRQKCVFIVAHYHINATKRSLQPFSDAIACDSSLAVISFSDKFSRKDATL
jgi:hypothetical protein